MQRLCRAASCRSRLTAAALTSSNVVEVKFLASVELIVNRSFEKASWKIFNAAGLRGGGIGEAAGTAVAAAPAATVAVVALADAEEEGSP